MFVCICLHACNDATAVLRACAVQVKRNGKIFTNPDNDANATSSAPDGDLDAAYALLLAGRKWNCSSYTDRGVKVSVLC